MDQLTADKLPENDVAYECAARQFEFLDRVFDGITARAATIMGWTALAVAGASYIQTRMDGHETARLVFAIFVVIPSLVSTILASLTFSLSAIRGWPDTRAVLEDYGNMSPKEARYRLACDLIAAIENNVIVLNSRRRLIKGAILSSSLLLLALIASIMGGLLLPSRSAIADNLRDTHGELCDERGRKEAISNASVDASGGGSGEGQGVPAAVRSKGVDSRTPR